MEQEKRIAALEEKVQELQREERKQEGRSVLTSISIIILAAAVIFGRWKINQILISIGTQIGSLNTTIDHILNVDLQIIGLLQNFQELLIRIIDLA